MSHIIIGTAGHIDHGKSSLVKRLTGTDPDRLSEEQERGMTIDLGFAFLNENIAFIDVPGHEKFIKNMVAGVSTVEMAMLVIAADDGVMPQTREHLDILSLLQLKTGLVALTKIDMVDKEWIGLVKDDITSLLKGTFLENTPIIPVSSTTGQGVEDIRNAIIEMAGKTKSRQDRGIFWMPIDRSFTIKGFGTVVTGSVLSGAAQVGDTVELLPKKQKVKLRGIQAHGKSVDAAQIGDRSALNLANISKDEIERGNVLATANYFNPNMIFDAKLQLLKSAKRPLKHRSRVRLHVGTREILCRIRPLDMDKIEPGETSFVQLLLEEEAVAIRRDPFVIRQYSPSVTIGGGIILDTNPPKRHKRFDKAVLDKMAKMERQDPQEILQTTLLTSSKAPISLKDLAKNTGLADNELTTLVDTMVNQNQVVKMGPPANPSFFHIINLNRAKNQFVDILLIFHQNEPLRPGMNKAEFKNKINITPQLFDLCMKELISDNKIIDANQLIKLSSHKIELAENDRKIADSINAILLENQFTTPNEAELAKELSISQNDVSRILGALQGLEEIIRMEGNIYFHRNSIKRAREIIANCRKTSEEISVSTFREELNTSRKYAMAILGYFDKIGLTERVGEVRLINI